MLDFESPAPSVLERTTRILIRITPSSTSQDQKLSVLQTYFEHRLEEWEALELPEHVSQLIIDLGILGTRDYASAQEPAPYWNQGPVYPIRLDRSQVIFGPLSLPEQADSPCPHCLERRWFSLRPQEMQMAFMFAQAPSITSGPADMTPFALETIWQTLSAIFQRLSKKDVHNEHSYPYYVLNFPFSYISQYYLLQDSTCPVCAVGVPDTPEGAVLDLETRPKRSISQYRLNKATEYNLPVSSLVNPVGGVLGATALPYLDSTLTAPVSGLFFMRNDFATYKAWWSGHGNSYHQSLYLGLLEALERHAGHTVHGKILRCFDSYENIAGTALDPRECGLYTETFYRQNPHAFQPFDPARPIWWVWGYSFRQRRPTLVPEQLVYYMNRGRGDKFVQECSNGCATGSCMEEAIFYGLLELIERDAFLLAWYARLAPPRIDPRSSRQKETLFLLEKIEQQGYELHLFDTRLDICIPSVVGIARRKKAGPGNIVVAAGCSMDPEDAIRGALCEIASYIPGQEERVENQRELLQELVRDYTKVQELTHHALLYGTPEMADKIDFFFQNPCMRSVEETYRDWLESLPRTLDLRDDLHYCIGLMEQLGMDVIVVEQTSPEQKQFGLKTACVIVPGLLPIDFGWGRERALGLPRLRTVPRTAGFRHADFEPDISDILPHPFP